MVLFLLSINLALRWLVEDGWANMVWGTGCDTRPPPSSVPNSEDHQTGTDVGTALSRGQAGLFGVVVYPPPTSW